MSTSNADVVIVGGGLEGLSTAWALTQRGVGDVVVVERDTFGSGFTAKSSGIIRCHYGTPSLAAMSWHSLPVLENANEVLGVDISYHRTGYLVAVGPENLDPLRANVAMQQGLGIDVSLLTHGDVAEIFPALRTDDYAAFAFEPRGAHADAFQTASGFWQQARERGARAVQGRAATAVRTGSGKVQGVTLASGDSIGASVVVVAAGPWSSPVLRSAGVDLPVRAMREQLAIVDPVADVTSLPVLSDLVSLQYLRPEGASHLLVGNSDHHHHEYADPDRYANPMDEPRLIETVEKFTHRFPDWSSTQLVTTYSGCYDVTPDFNPVLSRAGDVDGLFACAGFSGHGFKISPLVGEVMADLITNTSTTPAGIDAADFRLERFTEGALLTSRHPYVGAAEMR